ncbi:hypothetical protein ACIQU6_30855 [Streptomyces sp. NPDC090442]|uniref:hypothetical protein n=1 Tax=Streptomyces sp. NPDC090442 TaxID=3365962 RepID=UPI00381D934D
METATRTVPRWPCYVLTTEADGTITLDGPAADPGPYRTREDATAAVAAVAGRVRRPVRAHAADADGTVWPLLVTPEATVIEDGPAVAKPKRQARKSPPQAKAPDRKPAAATPPPSTPTAPRTPTAPPPRRPALTVEAPRSRPAPPPSRQTMPTVLTIRSLEQAGQLHQAAKLAADLEGGAVQAHGPSHPDAVNARELHAYLRAKIGELATAARLYRDVAERQWHRRDYTAANTSAAAAHSAWLHITDLDEAIDVGRAIVRMRNLIPGEGMRAYHSARSHQAKLETQAAQRP